MSTQNDWLENFPVKRAVWALVLVALFLILVFPPQAPKGNSTFTGDKQFRTTDDSRIFFKNIRITNYYKEQPKGVKADLYRLRRFNQTHTRPMLYPIIVDNWRSDEAYIFIEKNKFAFSEPLHLRWLATNDSIIGSYTMEVPNRPAQYELAGNIYQALQKGYILEVKTKKGRFVPLLAHDMDRSHFLTVLRDYYKLTLSE